MNRGYVQGGCLIPVGTTERLLGIVVVALLSALLTVTAAESSPRAVSPSAPSPRAVSPSAPSPRAVSPSPRAVSLSAPPFAPLRPGAPRVAPRRPPASRPASRPAYGAVRGVIFDAAAGHAPVGGAVIQVVGGSRFRTTADGAFHVAWPASRIHLRIIRPDQVVHVELNVVAGQTAEVLITLRPGQPAHVGFELPAARQHRPRPRQADPDQLVAVRGQVLHLVEGTPISGAQVFAKGSSAQARTDEQGFFVLYLPPGRHDLAVIHPRFGTARVREVRVMKTRQLRASKLVTVKLAPLAGELPDLVVSVPKIEGSTASLLEERQTSQQVTDVIGAEEMAQSGDSDAAGALKRVTGITVVGGKYIYVRGLGERYSATLLNGATLPSPEPERRVVPLDMFPVALLESVVIQKTWSADIPGGFAGGTVKLRTRGFPGTFVAKLKLSVGWLTGTTLGENLDYVGGKLDWLGVDDGTRALPGPVRRASANQSLSERDRFSDTGYTVEELERFGEMMPRKFSLDRKRTLPQLGLGLTIGDSFKVWGRKAGYLFAFTFKNDWDKDDRVLRYTTLNGGVLELSHTYDLEELENEIVLAGIGVLGIDLAKGHRLRLTSLVDRITTDTARRYEGYNRDLGASIRVSRLRWVERMLIVNQLRGEHDLSPLVEGAQLDLSWRYTFSAATRSEPDRRDYRYDLEDEETGLWLLSNRPEGNSRFFSELTDYNHDVGLDAKTAFTAWLGLEATVRGGVNLMLKDREVDTRRYHFLDKGPLSRLEEVRSAPLEIAFSPEYISPEGWQFQEFTRPTDNYFARHRVWALYALADLPLYRGLTLTAGVRVEGSRQEVTTFELFNPDAEPDRAVLDDVDPLPAVGLTYRFYEKMLVRAYYARTVNRPDFRELSTATFNDVTGGRQVFGNPDLERATIDNYDLRWEWYPTRHTHLSVAGFFKQFHRPIESVVIPSAQFSVTFDNARGAQNMGLEVAGRLGFGLLHRSLRDLYLGGNIAWIRSRVRLNDAGIQTSQKRALQGQSPYVVNLRLGYDNADLGLTANLLYNVFGERIMQVGALGAPDVIQVPFHILDLVIKYKLPHGFSLTFKAKNLIDQQARFTQGDFTVEQSRKGREFSLGLTKKF